VQSGGETARIVYFTPSFFGGSTIFESLLGSAGITVKPQTTCVFGIAAGGVGLTSRGWNRLRYGLVVNGLEVSACGIRNDCPNSGCVATSNRIAITDFTI
jgi:hypothetical protein